jgi:hypothetical protein
MAHYAMLAGPLYSAVAKPLSVAAAASNRIGSNPVNSVIAELNRVAAKGVHPTECSLLSQTA